MPGVVTTPANSTATPVLRNPSASHAAISGPDSRVSMPIRTGFDASDCRCKSSPSAMPSAVTVRASSGGLPATPRIPSVPNNLFAILSCFSGFVLNVNLNCNLRRVENPNLRFSFVNAESLLRVVGNASEIEWIRNQFLRFADPALRTRDT